MSFKNPTLSTPRDGEVDAIVGDEVGGEEGCEESREDEEVYRSGASDCSTCSVGVFESEVRCSSQGKGSSEGEGLRSP